MKALFSYIAYGFLWILAWLPLTVLYVLSDLLYPLVYYVIRYRRDVVRRNLNNAFPEKDKAEKKIIERKFYHYFCDLIVEIVKMIHLTPEQLLKRVKVINYERFEELKKKKIHGIIAAGHYANWEWTCIFPSITSYNTMGVYKPLHDRVIDKLLYKARKKDVGKLVTMEQTYRAIMRYHSEDIPTLSLFIADQTPARDKAEYFTLFLNQETAVFLGIEKIARKFNEPVFFFKMTKVRRGHYVLDIIDCCTDPEAEEPYSITEKHVRLLEDIIREKPEYWLWTHRRWKYTSADIKNHKVIVTAAAPGDADR